jgi:hypothetical protein
MSTSSARKARRKRIVRKPRRIAAAALAMAGIALAASQISLERADRGLIIKPPLVHAKRSIIVPRPAIVRVESLEFYLGLGNGAAALQLAGSGGGNDAATKILLHFDGTDASTTFTNSAIGGSHAFTANGNAQLDTAAFKFGTASYLGDGTGDFITTADHANFTLGSADFTMEIWARAASTGAARMMCGQIDSGAAAATSTWYMQRQTASNLVNFALSNGTTFTFLQSTTGLSADGNFHHFAFVRSGTTIRLFFDGVQEDSDTFSGAAQDSSVNLSVGRAGELASQSWDGWLDEFRMSVGIARWTSNFTPPTAPYY